jgi:hypothetical protein
MLAAAPEEASISQQPINHSRPRQDVMERRGRLIPPLRVQIASGVSLDGVIQMSVRFAPALACLHSSDFGWSYKARHTNCLIQPGMRGAKSQVDDQGSTGLHALLLYARTLRGFAIDGTKGSHQRLCSYHHPTSLHFLAWSSLLLLTLVQPLDPFFRSDCPPADMSSLCDDGDLSVVVVDVR